MMISPAIPIAVEDIIHELNDRQQAPWADGRINDDMDFPCLNKLYEAINRGIPKEDFMYRGPLFRIHTQHGGLKSCLNLNKQTIIGPVYSDGSCSYLDKTEYTDRLVTFTYDGDFTRFSKVYNEMAIIITADTKELCGIDVNAFRKRFGCEAPWYTEEKEVLFPLMAENVIKEYRCSPHQFNYYMRKNSTVR